MVFLLWVYLIVFYNLEMDFKVPQQQVFGSLDYFIAKSRNFVSFLEKAGVPPEVLDKESIKRTLDLMCESRVAGSVMYALARGELRRSFEDAWMQKVNDNGTVVWYLDRDAYLKKLSNNDCAIVLPDGLKGSSFALAVAAKDSEEERIKRLTALKMGINWMEGLEPSLKDKLFRYLELFATIAFYT